MRTIFALVCLGFVATTMAATSSSTSSSSTKTNTTSSSSTSVSTSISGTGLDDGYGSYGIGNDCSPGSGGDAPCITLLGADGCCYYSWYQYTGETEVTSYDCTLNPSKDSLLSDAENLADSAFSDVTGSSGYTSGGYCANAVLVKASLAVGAIAGALYF